MTTACSRIDGHPNLEGSTHDLFNPADLDQQIGELILAGPAEAMRAMDGAEACAVDWRTRRLDERMGILDRVLKSVEVRREEIAVGLTLENGKTLQEARAEVDGSLRDGRYQLEFIAKQGISEGLPTSETRFAPLGVVALITPWNFPLATIIRKLIPALALGNTVVVKASEITPLTACRLWECLASAGLPRGTAQLVLGEGPVVGPAILSHRALRAISFTGSTATGQVIARAVGGLPVRLQLEMGGKNALVVLEDADLSSAADAVAFAGFSVAGQWCTSTSRVIVAESVYDAFVDLLRARASEVVVGDGRRGSTTMGPVVSETQHAKVKASIARARASGAQLLAGGGTPERVDSARGWWVEPTVFGGVEPDADLARTEIFGPVLALLSARDADHALALANDSEYGLAFSVYAGDPDTAERFVDDVEVGVTHINLPTSYREPAYGLTGWGASGFGVPEAGGHARDFYTKPRVIYRAPW